MRFGVAEHLPCFSDMTYLLYADCKIRGDVKENGDVKLLNIPLPNLNIPKMGMLRIIGWDYWIRLLDGFFHPNMGSVVVRSSQGRFFSFFRHALLCSVPRRGVLILLLRAISQK